MVLTCPQLRAGDPTRPLLIELLLPRVNFRPRVPQVFEPANIQTLVSQFVLNAFATLTWGPIFSSQLHESGAPGDPPWRGSPGLLVSASGGLYPVDRATDKSCLCL